MSFVRKSVPISRMFLQMNCRIKTVGPRLASITLNRGIHHQEGALSQKAASVSPANKTVKESIDAFKLDGVKVFQEEQLIQLTFESGQVVNYPMAWLRNLCSCPSCIDVKFGNKTYTEKPVEGELSVGRVKCIREEELLIEWVDSNYKSHLSHYNLKYLNLYASQPN